MRQLAFFLSILVLLTFGGCESANDQFRSGRIIISSAFDFSTAKVRGYNFELDDYLEYPSSFIEKPDILLEQFREVGGAIKPGLSAPDGINSFALIYSSGSLEESFTYFEELSEIDSTLTYLPSSDTVRLFQVYAVRTSLLNYAKIHVRDIVKVSGASGEYLEVELDYQYLKDGTRSFPE